MEQEKLLLASQLRAARALCDMSQEAVAAAAGVSSMTVKRAEGSGNPYPADKAIAAIQAALEAAGVIFLADGNEGPGVRLRK